MTSANKTNPVEDAERIVAVAHRLADAARAETLSLFRSPALRPDNKAATGFDPVTEADRASERAMRAILAAERPEDAILGEEYGEMCEAVNETMFDNGPKERLKGGYDNIRKEAVQVAAVAMALVEAIDRNRDTWEGDKNAVSMG